MGSKAKASRQTLLQRGDGGGTEVFTTIGEVKDISGPSESVGEIDVTSQDSTAKEFIADLPDNGEVSMEMNFIGSDAQQQGLRTDLRAGTLRNFKLVFNDHATTKTTAAFTALVKSFDVKAPGSGAYSASATLKLTGPATWTYAPA